MKNFPRQAAICRLAIVSHVVFLLKTPSRVVRARPVPTPPRAHEYLFLSNVASQPIHSHTTPCCSKFVCLRGRSRHGAG